jgi:uncharacterized membrane protein SpoIIM required for sporulation
MKRWGSVYTTDFGGYRQLVVGGLGSAFAPLWLFWLGVLPQGLAELVAAVLCCVGSKHHYILHSAAAAMLAGLLLTRFAPSRRLRCFTRSWACCTPCP